ncbi:MAG TPA: 50S ribosomal protein L15 [bacterium]|nr:50S ribosomal protein L15 [bacterium]
MKMNQLKPARGAVRRRKIVGKGPGSGHGKTSTRGHKGQNSRTGGGVRLGFEGGQTPLYRRIPIRGFKSLDLSIPSVVNLDRLAIFADGAVVTPVELKAKGLVKNVDQVKILGKGELKLKLTVKAHAFSASALEKIKAAGGVTEVL